MDAKDRLRLYLEQRRDAGESELVLDSLSVEEVLRLLGAGAAGRPGTGSASGGSREGVADTGERRTSPPERQPLPPSPHAAAQATSQPADWREALRALEPAGHGDKGGAPGVPPAEARRAGPRSDSERAPAPAPSAPTVATSDAPPSRPAAGVAPPDPGRDESGVPPETAPSSTMIPATGAGSREPSHATLPLDQLPTGIVVGSPAHELFGGPQSPFATLTDIAAATQACTLCTLHKTAKQAVPGEGDPNADFVCVGEAPGANEDEQGRPFVGQAGQLLTKILAAIDLSREDVFICNVLKHRPPGNRNPTPDEVAACSPYLVRQMELLKPKVIVALGTFAAQTLLQTREPIGKLRGKIHRYYGVPLVVTYHPAALLRNPSWKRPTWEDVQLARRLLDRARGT